MLALAGLARRKRARGTPQREIRPRGTPAQTTPYCIPTRPGAAGPHKVSIRDMGGGRRRAPAGSWSRAARRHPRDADPPRGADPQICRVERFRTASSLRPAVLRGSLSETATFAGLHLPSGAFSDARAFANWGFVRLPVQKLLHSLVRDRRPDLHPNHLRCDRKVRRTARPPPSKNRSRQASHPRGQTLEEWELPPPPRHAPARTLRPSHRSHARQTREPPCPRSPQAQQVRSGPSLARSRRRPRGRQATPTQPTGTWTWQSDVASASSPPLPASPAS